MNINDPKLLSSLLRIAKQTGELISEVYHRDDSLEIIQKADNSPLTEADTKAHEHLSKELGLLTWEGCDKRLPVLSEEGEHSSYADRKNWHSYWLIDPLDGTREFISRTGEFCTNIALVVGHKAVLGLVHIPELNVSYYAVEGSGAYRMESGKVPERIHVSLAHKELRLAVSRRHGKEALERLLPTLGDFELIHCGSAAKICLVASGKADLYPRLGPTSEWDTAAGQIILEEAGGKLTDLNMNPLQYNAKESLKNPSFIAVGDCHFDWQSLFSPIRN